MAIDTIFEERSGLRTSIKAVTSFVWARISLWRRIRRSRRALAHLSDDALADIGLTRDAALGEAIRPFWDSHRS
ncbi:DUF1127 domain-containing protein [Roseibium sp.]|uniref:DUF1127 domain-containing protein n=1 Tax=Roseibium sp. TaxID=1936156 RepID=UPI003A9872E5